MKKIIFLTLTMFILSGFAFQTNAQIIIKIKPPKPKVVVVKTKHRPHHIWVKGHWKTTPSGKFVWVEGHWIKKRHGFVWIDGHWKKVRGGWIWVPGHWKTV